MLNEKDLKKYKYEIEQIKLQEDCPARNIISNSIKNILIESNKGEIGMAIFIEKIEEQIKIAKELMAFWPED
jgi:hypothetical protein